VHRLSCLVQVQQVSSNACMRNMQVQVLLLSDSSEFRMRMWYLARSYYVLGLILRLRRQISGHRRGWDGAPQVFCGFTNDTVCEIELPDHQCRKPRSIPVDSCLPVICVLRRVLCDFFQATCTQGDTEPAVSDSCHVLAGGTAWSNRRGWGDLTAPVCGNATAAEWYGLSCNSDANVTSM
jgi:hypothetical protein